MRNVEFLKQELARRAGDFYYYLFPEGQVRYSRFYIGDLEGDRGRSLAIMWKDFVTDGGGNNLLDLLFKKRGQESFPLACEEVEEWLQLPQDYAKNAEISQTFREPDKELQMLDFSGLSAGSDELLRQLANTFGVHAEGLKLAQQQGILKFFKHPQNGICWSVVDAFHYARQDRRFDGNFFEFPNGSTAKARTLGCPRIPMGLPTKKPAILLCEGSSDLLAAFSLIYAEGFENEIAPVTILGASNCIHADYLRHFQGKFVIAFPNYDSAGIRGMTLWEQQLRGIAADFVHFDYEKLRRDDEK